MFIGQHRQSVLFDFFFLLYDSRVAAVSLTAATTTSTICQLCIIIVVRITVSEHSPFSDAY